MGRRMWTMVAGGSALVVATGLVAAGSAGADEGRRARVIELTATTVAGGPPGVDTGDPGNSLGDYFVLRNTLSDTDGKVVGTSAGMFVTVDVADPATLADDTRLASVGLDLANGDITLQGFVYPGQDNTIAVTGGTGAYRTASGEMTFTPKVGPVNTYFLRLRLHT